MCAARRQKPKIKLFRNYFGHWRSHMMIISMKTFFYFDPGLFWAWPPVLAALNFILGFGATLSALHVQRCHLAPRVFWVLARHFILGSYANFILGVGDRKYFGLRRLFLIWVAARILFWDLAPGSILGSGAQFYFGPLACKVSIGRLCSVLRAHFPISVLKNCTEGVLTTRI